MPHTGRRETCEVVKKNKDATQWTSVPPGNGRLSDGAQKRNGPRSALRAVISSVCAPQNPTGLTRPNARSALTERLACLRGGGG